MTSNPVVTGCGAGDASEGLSKDLLIHKTPLARAEVLLLNESIHEPLVTSYSTIFKVDWL